MKFFKNLKRALKFERQQEKRGFDDSILWELFSNLGEYIYPRLKAFRDMKKVGFPTYFSEWDKNQCSKEEYDEMVKNGQRDADVAAGRIKPEDAWQKVLDKMVYTFEYVVYVEGGKSFEEQRPFWKHYFGFSPWDEDYKCNEYSRWSYRNDRGHLTWTFSDPKREDAKHSLHYGNSEIMSYAYERSLEGLEFFTRFFYSLWD